MLPNLNNTETSQTQSITGWAGLNISDATTDGEVVDSQNLSSLRYPHLSPRANRSETGDYNSPTAVFAWDNLVVVDGNGTLYYDNVSAGNLTVGEKQIAGLNNDIIIFPDKKYFNTKDSEFGNLEKSATSTSEVICATNTMSFTVGKLYQSDVMLSTLVIVSSGSYPCCNTYGTKDDMDSIDWSASAGWTLPTSSVKNMFTTSTAVGSIILPSATYNSSSKTYTFGVADWVFSTSSTPDTSDENDLGFFGVVKKLVDEDGSTGYGTAMNLYVDIYYTEQQEISFEDLFEAGDVVSVSGFTTPWLNFDKNLIIDSIDGNTLTFSDGQFLPPTTYMYRSADATAGETIRYRGYSTNDIQYYYWFDLDGDFEDDIIDGGFWVYQYDTTFKLWRANEDGGEFFATYEYTHLNSSASQYGYDTSWGTGTTFPTVYANGITVTMDIPDLDFICQRANHIWGVSNEDNTVYVSALGDATRWFKYSGLTTDSYAVVVGSAGNFTAICAYGDYTLCFKENVLHTFGGSYPSTYVSYDSDIEGVQAGSHKSIAIINEVLYYKGKDGIFAYGGSVPTLVSYNLGNQIYTDAVGGADGMRYYVSMLDNNGYSNLFCYDTIHGIWYREDDVTATDFCTLGNDVYMACTDGVFKLGTSGDISSSTQWSATLVDFDEDTYEHKQYNYLRIMADMESGSSFSVDVSIDGGDAETVYTTSTAGKRFVHMLLPRKRARRMTVTIYGSGDVTIRKLDRQYTTCSGFTLQGD